MPSNLSLAYFTFVMTTVTLTLCIYANAYLIEATVCLILSGIILGQEKKKAGQLDG